MDNYDVIVIGGGASGMMAAIVAARNSKKILLIEKNKKLGEKLRITGGGRCNITNATYDDREMLKNYGDASSYLFSSFSKFSVRDTFSFFEKINLPIVVEGNNRAFPKSQKALDVVNAMISELKRLSVEIKTNSPVEKVLFEEIKIGESDNKIGVFKNKISGVVVAGKTYSAHNYIFSTGGVSHPETGSTGDGFGWLRQVGHTVKNPTPTIVPISTSDKWSHILSGISLENMKITFYLEKIGELPVKQFSKKGKVLFTHFGLSGPLILNSANLIWDLLQEGSVIAKIDCYPDFDIGALDEKITHIFDQNKNKMLKNVLKEIVPTGIAPGIAFLLQEDKNNIVDLETKVHSVKKDDRRKIVNLLKGLPINVTGLMDFGRAVVADGGVNLDEIDMKNMRSKICENLFVTGDLLDIRRPSGGYSLQLCWTTGFVAGSEV